MTILRQPIFVCRAQQLAILDRASAPENAMIYGLFSDAGRQNVVFGGSAVSSSGTSAWQQISLLACVR
jgi:hypothetical protein